MSRVGKKLIVLPKTVEVKQDGQQVFIKGPKGELNTLLHSCVSLKVEDTSDGRVLRFTVEKPEDVGQKAQWGTAQANVMNLVSGVTDGFSKRLELEGVGYRVSLTGDKLVLGLGFSHDVHFPLPKGIQAQVEKNAIVLSGIDKKLVGETAARIRRIRKPEPYKGKGIRYSGEHIRRKAGKASKSAE